MLRIVTILFFCAYVSATICPGYYYAPTSKCFVYGTSYVSRPMARAFCQGQGGDLASIHSRDEDDFILGIQKNSTLKYMWIGMDISNVSSFSWSDGSPVDYLNFYSGSSCTGTPYVRKQNAAPAKNGSWFCAYSDDKNYAMCELFGTSPPSPPASSCQSSSGRCYQFSTASLSWDQAYTSCLQLGGDLVSIHSSADNHFISSEAKKRSIGAFWTGFNRELSQTINYTWSDATPITYTNWNTGVPGSCLHGAQDCVSMDATKMDWYNCWQCSQALPYVCEMPQHSDAMAMVKGDRFDPFDTKSPLDKPDLIRNMKRVN